MPVKIQGLLRRSTGKLELVSGQYNPSTGSVSVNNDDLVCYVAYESGDGQSAFGGFAGRVCETDTALHAPDLPAPLNLPIWPKKDVFISRLTYAPGTGNPPLVLFLGSGVPETPSPFLSLSVTGSTPFVLSDAAVADMHALLVSAFDHVASADADPDLKDVEGVDDVISDEQKLIRKTLQARLLGSGVGLGGGTGNVGGVPGPSSSTSRDALDDPSTVDDREDLDAGDDVYEFGGTGTTTAAAGNASTISVASSVMGGNNPLGLNDEDMEDEGDDADEDHMPIRGRTFHEDEMESIEGSGDENDEGEDDDGDDDEDVDVDDDDEDDVLDGPDLSGHK